MLELHVMKVTCAVLRRERGSNPSDLADKPHVRICEGLALRGACLLDNCEQPSPANILLIRELKISGTLDLLIKPTF